MAMAILMHPIWGAGKNETNVLRNNTQVMIRVQDELRIIMIIIR